MNELDILGVEATLGDTSFQYDLRLSGSGIFAVTGTSGSGKTTFFDLLAGFTRPTRGTVSFEGRDISNLAPGKRPLTYIFQDHNLFAHLDVFDNVAIGVAPSMRVPVEQRQEIEAALRAVGLEGKSHRAVKSLSGGERQRVAFARALVRRKPVLLLDEAFASLDAAMRRSLGQLLQTLQEEHHLLVLMITHDREEILRLADKVIVIDRGHIVFYGMKTEWTDLPSGTNP